MNSAVVATFITSGVSLVIATGTAIWSGNENRKLSKVQTTSAEKLEGLRHKLEGKAREEERRTREAEAFATYREPLLEAARDLLHRLANITKREFLLYLEGDRHDAAVQFIDEQQAARLVAQLGMDEDR